MTNEVTRHWTISPPVVLTWIVLGLPLIVLGIWLFGAVYLLTHGVRELSMGLGIPELLLLLVITAGLMALHELVHALAMRRMGAAPSFGADILEWVSLTSIIHTQALSLHRELERAVTEMERLAGTSATR